MVKIIKSVQDLFTIVDWHEFSSRRVLFRGQDVDEPLLPKFARIAKERKLSAPIQHEIELYEAFRKQSPPFLISSIPTNEWDWLAVAQHFGLPTRLLDWTSNAFIGLWFAVNARMQDEQIEPVFWVLESTPDDIKSPLDNEKLEDLKRTYIFQPSTITNRIAAQAGWFTIHKYIEGKNTCIPLNKNSNFTKKLTKYSIPKNACKTIRTELRQMGINRFSLFPDLAGLCEILADEILYCDEEWELS